MQKQLKLVGVSIFVGIVMLFAGITAWWAWAAWAVAVLILVGRGFVVLRHARQPPAPAGPADPTPPPA